MQDRRRRARALLVALSSTAGLTAIIHCRLDDAPASARTGGDATSGSSTASPPDKEASATVKDLEQAQTSFVNPSRTAERSRPTTSNPECRYTLRELRTERLGGQPVAAHEVTLVYRLLVRPLAHNESVASVADHAEGAAFIPDTGVFGDRDGGPRTTERPAPTPPSMPTPSSTPPGAASQKKISNPEQTAIRDAGGWIVDAVVEHIEVTARKAEYSVRLDSREPGVRHRVEGGADLALMFEPIHFFALLDVPLAMTVNSAGGLPRIDGGERLRRSLIGMLPPAARASAHWQKRSELALSDTAVATVFLPWSTAIPRGETVLARGEVLGAETAPDRPRQGTGAVDLELEEGRAFGREAWRIRAVDGDIFVERKIAFERSSEPPIVPRLSGSPRVELLEGDQSVTVRLHPGDPCFREAGSSLSTTSSWSGTLEREEITTKREVLITRVWARGF